MLIYVRSTKRQLQTQTHTHWHTQSQSEGTPGLEHKEAPDKVLAYVQKHTERNAHPHCKVIDTWRNPYLYIIECVGHPSVSIVYERVGTALLKVLNVYVVLFHPSITLLSMHTQPVL